MTALLRGDRITPWAEGLPTASALVPLKYITRTNVRVLPEATPPDTTLSYIDIGNVDATGAILGVEEFTFEKAPSRARRLPKDGETIVSTVRTYLRAIAHIHQPPANLVCSTGFAVISPGPRVHPRFLYYWLRSDPVVDEICARSVGVSYPAVNASELGSLPVPVLSLNEQHHIANFLDRKTAIIDELIAQKERLVELLAEKRQAIITQAVTKGLDPNVPMKESGVEWIGLIPDNWNVARIGYLGRVKNGSTPDRGEPDYWTEGTIPWLSSGKVNDYIVTEPDEYITQRALREYSLELLPPETVLVGMIGQGKTRGLSAITTIATCINQNTAGIVAGSRLYARYLLLVLTAAYRPLREFGRGGQQDALTCQIIGGFRVPVPPLDEQGTIISFVENHVRRIGGMRMCLERSIHKLREYRQALITAAVTGNLDVTHEAHDAR